MMRLSNMIWPKALVWVVLITIARAGSRTSSISRSPTATFRGRRLLSGRGIRTRLPRFGGQNHGGFLRHIRFAHRAFNDLPKAVPSRQPSELSPIPEMHP